MQRLQYISDFTGRNVAVLIPISEWENIVRKHADLKMLEPESGENKSLPSPYTMGDFAGILSADKANALLKHAEQSRDEWERNF